MNKLFKGVLATVLSVGFLAGCGGGETSTPTSEPTSEAPVLHLVTFWEDNVGKFYDEVEVEHGDTVTMPDDPVREGYSFEGWFLETTYETEFVETTPIESDLDLYGSWKKDYVPDERTFHIIGDLQNTAYESSWDTSEDAYTNTHLTKAEDSNLFTIEIEIGYMGKFKVKEPGKGWDAGQEYDYTDIPGAENIEFIKEGDTRNVQFKTAGLYKVQVETDLNELYVERLGDAVAETVVQDPDPNSILNWGLVGSITGWSEEAGADIALAHVADPGYHFLKAYYFAEGDAFKFRVDGSWATQIGASADMELPVGIGAETEVVGEETVIKEGGNFIVETAGFYSAIIQKVEDVNVLTLAAVGFGLRGDALTGGWDADSEAMAFVDAVTVEEVTTYTYEGTYEMTAGSFKVKRLAFGPYNGWDTAFGDGENDFTVSEAGIYTVTLEVTFDAETMAFTGTASFAAVVDQTQSYITLFLKGLKRPAQAGLFLSMEV